MLTAICLAANPAAAAAADPEGPGASWSRDADERSTAPIHTVYVINRRSITGRTAHTNPPTRDRLRYLPQAQ